MFKANAETHRQRTRLGIRTRHAPPQKTSSASPQMIGWVSTGEATTVAGGGSTDTFATGVGTTTEPGRSASAHAATPGLGVSAPEGR